MRNCLFSVLNLACFKVLTLNWMNKRMKRKKFRLFDSQVLSQLNVDLLNLWLAFFSLSTLTCPLLQPGWIPHMGWLPFGLSRDCVIFESERNTIVRLVNEILLGQTGHLVTQPYQYALFSSEAGVPHENFTSGYLWAPPVLPVIYILIFCTFIELFPYLECVPH